MNLNLTLEQFASVFNVNKSTISRWESGLVVPDYITKDSVYSFSFKRGIRLNQIKELLYKEKLNVNQKLLFHGSKTGLIGKVSVDKSAKFKDFGQGFYLGETLEQAGMFVASYPMPKLYYFAYTNDPSIKELCFSLDLDWVIAICYNRGYLESYKESPKVKQILDSVAKSQVIIAPTADNQMFDIMKDFADGNITDIECIHSLAATNLGFQYVFKNDEAIQKHLLLLEESFLCSKEKEYLLSTRETQSKNNSEKIKIVKREYRGSGKYIDQLL